MGRGTWWTTVHGVAELDMGDFFFQIVVNDFFFQIVDNVHIKQDIFLYLFLYLHAHTFEPP